MKEISGDNRDKKAKKNKKLCDKKETQNLLRSISNWKWN